MSLQSIKTTLVNGAAKAGVVAVVSGLASLAFTNGGQSAAVFGHELPRFVVAGASMAAASYAGDIVVPYIVPWTSANNAILKKFEQSTLQPLIVGFAATLVDSVISPESVAEVGGPAKSLLIGAGSSILAYYVIDSTGLLNLTN